MRPSPTLSRAVIPLFVQHPLFTENLNSAPGKRVGPAPQLLGLLGEGLSRGRGRGTWPWPPGLRSPRDGHLSTGGVSSDHKAAHGPSLLSTAPPAARGSPHPHAGCCQRCSLPQEALQACWEEAAPGSLPPPRPHPLAGGARAYNLAQPNDPPLRRPATPAPPGVGGLLPAPADLGARRGPGFPIGSRASRGPGGRTHCPPPSGAGTVGGARAPSRGQCRHDLQRGRDGDEGLAA